MKQHGLSVVLATFNEERNLERCLESVSKICDEIVIADGTSTDKTVEIARKFGARVISTTNKQNFHINKQMAIDAAKYEWILQMDADEVVGDRLAQEIKDIVKGKSKENGYWMPRKNYFLGRFLMKGGQYPDYTIRLYRNGKGHLPQKDVHEQAVVVGKVGYLKEALLHYPYFGFGHYLAKWNKYNDFYAKQISEEESRKNLLEKFFSGVLYLLIRPAHWLLTTYFRHKGFMDSWQGFVFSLFSALRFPVSYIKYIGVYKFLFLVILLIGFFFRFWNFFDRIGFGGDDARDALIALESIQRMQMPLVGSFSSAGPFVFGGFFYNLIMASYVVFPFSIFSPFILTALAGVFLIGVMMWLGLEIAGKKLSLIVGILVATSPQLIARSTSLGQHTYVTLFSALSFLSLFLLWRTKKLYYAFLIGLFLGIALNFHYQALNLLVLIPAVLLVGISLRKKILSFALVILGFVVPLLPMIYWDSFQGFANFRNVADYFLIGQHRIYVPNSWTIYLFDFLPSHWGFVVGSFYAVGVCLLFGSFALFAIKVLGFKISLKMILIYIIFLVILFVNRYYKGERSEGYLLYMLPLIMIISSWFIHSLIFSKNKVFKLAGLIIMTAVLVGNIFAASRFMSNQGSYNSTRKITESLYNKYPTEKFAIYDYDNRTYNISSAVSLLAEFDGRADINGKKIGIGCRETNCYLGNHKVIEKDKFYILDLSSGKFTSDSGWINVNRESVYEDLTGWLSKHQLASSFSFLDFIKSKLEK